MGFVLRVLARGRLLIRLSWRRQGRFLFLFAHLLFLFTHLLFFFKHFMLLFTHFLLLFVWRLNWPLLFYLQLILLDAFSRLHIPLLALFNAHRCLICSG